MQMDDSAHDLAWRRFLWRAERGEVNNFSSSVIVTQRGTHPSFRVLGAGTALGSLQASSRVSAVLQFLSRGRWRDAEKEDASGCFQRGRGLDGGRASRGVVPAEILPPLPVPALLQPSPAAPCPEGLHSRHRQRPVLLGVTAGWPSSPPPLAGGGTTASPAGS